MKEEIRWIIVGIHGLYIGQYLTRKDAINDHTICLGKNWRYCKRKGDKAIKAKIQYEEIK